MHFMLNYFPLFYFFCTIWQTIENEKFSVVAGESISFFEVLMGEYPFAIHPGNFFFQIVWKKKSKFEHYFALKKRLFLVVIGNYGAVCVNITA